MEYVTLPREEPMADDLVIELAALCDEHDRFVGRVPPPNLVATAYYTDLLGRLARTVDAVLASGSTSGHEVVWRACAALGLACFVFDLTEAMLGGTASPASSVLARRFPPAAVEAMGARAMRSVVPGRD